MKLSSYQQTGANMQEQQRNSCGWAEHRSQAREQHHAIYSLLPRDGWFNGEKKKIISQQLCLRSADVGLAQTIDHNRQYDPHLACSESSLTNNYSHTFSQVPTEAPHWLSHVAELKKKKREEMEGSEISFLCTCDSSCLLVSASCIPLKGTSYRYA